MYGVKGQAKRKGRRGRTNQVLYMYMYTYIHTAPTASNEIILNYYFSNVQESGSLIIIFGTEFDKERERVLKKNLFYFFGSQNIWEGGGASERFF